MGQMLQKEDIVLYCPKYVGWELLHQGFYKVDQSPPGVKEVLLMRHPLTRVMIAYLRSMSIHDIKIWFMSFAPTPQFRTLNTTEIMHIESLHLDLLDYGIRIDPPEISTPNIDVCLTTRAAIRRAYRRDYEIGDYE